MMKVNPKQLMRELEINAAVGTPTMVWGPPGVGKSDIAYQLADKLGATLCELRANLFDPIDVRGGLKIIENDDRPGTYKTVYGIPEDYPASMSSDKWILFIDELPNASKATQNALLQLLLNKRIGTYTLPEDTIIVAAGNRAEDRAAVHDMPTPVANRFSHFVLDPDVDTWVEWAIKNDIDHRLISFIRFKGHDSLHNMGENHTIKAFPSPRSWAFVNRRIEYVSDPGEDLLGVASLVGEGPAGEYSAFIRLADSLPDIDDCIKRPRRAKVPTQGDTLYALVGALSARASEETFEDIMTYVQRIDSPEFQVAFVKDTMTRTKAKSEFNSTPDWIVESPKFLEWVEDNSEFLY